MKKLNKTKLLLTTEKLRELQTSDLAAVQGADGCMGANTRTVSLRTGITCANC
jgi:hypothetical protein